MTQEEEICALRAEVARLSEELERSWDEEITQLRTKRLARHLGVCPANIRIARILYRADGNIVSSESIRNAIGCTRDNNVATHITRLRRVLGADSIKNIPREGYYMTPLGRESFEEAQMEVSS